MFSFSKMDRTVLRITVASVCAMAFGAFYYNPMLNPFAKIWIKENHPDLKDLSNLNHQLAVALSSACSVILAIFINQYVNHKQLSAGRLLRMAVELSVLAACLQLPHTLFAEHSWRAFLIDQGHNLGVVIIESFLLGYNRF